jgi:S1-C subfamily serine protease
LLKHGRVVRGYLGVHVRGVPIPPPLLRLYNLNQTHGVEVQAVEPGSPAEQAGILEEDVIVSLGEQPTASVDDLHKLLTQLPVGIPAAVVVLRGDRRLERFVVPNEYPDPAPQT